MITIDSLLVQSLIEAQFPQWKDLPISPVALSGWDNRTFHLGNKMLVRLPSAAVYSSQVEKEHQWLPKLAPHLLVTIPKPLAMGKPAYGYPWKWSIYQWIEGESAARAEIANREDFAKSLAYFLLALQKIDPTGGPMAGPHSFYRGGKLTTYDTETRQALTALKGKIDTQIATKIWEEALASQWENMPVWVHGDIAPGNLLVKEGKLCAVIDFGQLAIGDPACDLAIAWTFFQGKNRSLFRTTLSLDANTWARARGWALWKALVVVAGLTGAVETAPYKNSLDEVMRDGKLTS